jgi:hypothetical protein
MTLIRLPSEIEKVTAVKPGLAQDLSGAEMQILLVTFAAVLQLPVA